MALPGRKLRTMHLFAGAGGGILADMLLGHVPVCAVEYAKYPRDVLLARQRDGCLPRFPIWDDVCTFDGKPWRGRVDVVSGGFPCTDISAAGKGAGIEGKQSGLWSEMARIIREVRPRYVFVENSPMLTSRGLGVVLGDLAEMGMDARWGVLGAHHVGAPHKRDRIWMLGHSDGDVRISDTAKQTKRSESRRAAGMPGVSPEQLANPSQHGRVTWWASDPAEESGGWQFDRGGECSDVAHADGPGCEQQRGTVTDGEEDATAQCESGRPTQSSVDRMAHELAHQLDQPRPPALPHVPRVATGVKERVARLKAIGNGQVPACAALAWSILGGPIT